MKLRLLFSIVLVCLVSSANWLSAQAYPKRELRAAWIATVANIDWPSGKGLHANAQQEEFVRLLDTLKAIGMNAVVVQVRPVADALYPSSFEPWSEYLSGEQGTAPEPYYNPLAFMIAQARQRGLEFHAWFNPYRVSMNEKQVLAANHVFYKHPQWFVQYGGKWYFDPGQPEAQEFVLQSIMETVKHYDLDAVHFDDYFYPYRLANVEFPDSCSYQDYGMNTFENKDDWRRENVDSFVQELSRRIKMEKPHVKFGISPFGVWRNKDKDPDGSDTQAGQTNYDDLYADVLRWTREGWIDYITPQLYWHIGFKVADYSILLDWWSKHAYGRHLYIGQGVYRMGGKGWENPEEIVNQINLNRMSSATVHGSMYFSAKFFLNNREKVNEKMRNVYRYPALVPTMSWMNSTAPPPAKIEKISGSQGRGVHLQWKDSISSNSAYYIVYKFEKNDAVNTDNPANIAAILPRQPYAIQSWVDHKTRKRTAYTYIVTAADRLHNESVPGKPITIFTRGKNGQLRLR